MSATWEAAIVAASKASKSTVQHRHVLRGWMAQCPDHHDAAWYVVQPLRRQVEPDLLAWLYKEAAQRVRSVTAKSQLLAAYEEDVRDAHRTSSLPAVYASVLDNHAVLAGGRGWQHALTEYVRCQSAQATPDFTGSISFLQQLAARHPYHNKFAAQLALTFPTAADTVRTHIYQWQSHPAAWRDALESRPASNESAKTALAAGQLSLATHILKSLHVDIVSAECAPFTPRRAVKSAMNHLKIWHAVVIDSAHSTQLDSREHLVGLHVKFLRRGCGYGLLEITLSHGRPYKANDLFVAGVIADAQHVLGAALVSSRVATSGMVVDSLTVEWNEDCVNVLTLLGWFST